MNTAKSKLDPQAATPVALPGWFTLPKIDWPIVGGSLAVLVVFLAAWEWLPGALGLPDFVLPPFSKVVDEFFRMLAQERLMYHSGITALEVVIGFVLGSLLGVLIGVLLGISPTTEAILSPYILALQIAPKVAFAPLFVMWLGYAVYPKILVAILIVFCPVMINVLGAVRTVDPDLINLARSLPSRWRWLRPRPSTTRWRCATGWTGRGSDAASWSGIRSAR